jgi:hypothetical protein
MPPIARRCFQPEVPGRRRPPRWQRHRTRQDGEERSKLIDVGGVALVGASGPADVDDIVAVLSQGLLHGRTDGSIPNDNDFHDFLLEAHTYRMVRLLKDIAVCRRALRQPERRSPDPDCGTVGTNYRTVRLP